MGAILGLFCWLGGNFSLKHVGMGVLVANERTIRLLWNNSSRSLTRLIK